MENQNGTSKCCIFPAYHKQPMQQLPPRHGSLGIENASQLEKQSLGEKKCLLCVCIALLSPMILLLLLAIHSKMEASYQEPLFQIESVRVFPFNLTSSRITANWNITLLILSPKSDPMTCEILNGSVYLRSEKISFARMKNKFYLDDDTNSKKRMAINFGASNVYINKTVGEGVIAQREEEFGVVSFSLEFEGNVRIYVERTREFEERVRVMVVHCVDIKVRFASSNEVGTLLHGPLKCQTAVVEPDKRGRVSPTEVYYGMHN